MDVLALLVVIGAMWISAFLCWLRYSETSSKRWIAATVACILAGIIVNQSLPTTGTFHANADCYIDWDGRSNPTVCD